MPSAGYVSRRLSRNEDLGTSPVAAGVALATDDTNAVSVRVLPVDTTGGPPSACGDPILDMEIAVEGGTVGPVPEDAEDVCLHIVVAPLPGAVTVWHDHEVIRRDD